MPKTSTRPMVRIHNLATNEIIDREMDDAELAKHEAYLAEQASLQAEAKAKAAEKVTLLDRLGLTEDELKTILG